MVHTGRYPISSAMFILGLLLMGSFLQPTASRAAEMDIILTESDKGSMAQQSISGKADPLTEDEKVIEKCIKGNGCMTMLANGSGGCTSGIVCRSPGVTCSTGATCQTKNFGGGQCGCVCM